MSKNNSIDQFEIGQSIYLEPCQGWPKEAYHHFDQKQALAVMAATAIGRPLLLTGEPGCGKTQMARAAAQVLGMPMTGLVVNERTEPEDLCFCFDALRRLSDANSREVQLRAESAYLSAGPLWWAFNHTSAKEHKGTRSCRPDMAADSSSPRDFSNGVAVLIDEIDKADRSVPNSLLEPLGSLSFQVPYLGESIACDKGNSPLIIITSNGEQQLPQAFVRRCLVLDMSLDDSSRDLFVNILVPRGKALFEDRLETLGTQSSEDIFERAAKDLYSKRMAAKNSGFPMIPGQAEYLDFLEAFVQMKQSCILLLDEDIYSQLQALTFDKNGG